MGQLGFLLDQCGLEGFGWIGLRSNTRGLYDTYTILVRISFMYRYSTSQLSVRNTALSLIVNMIRLVLFE